MLRPRQHAKANAKAKAKAKGKGKGKGRCIPGDIAPHGKTNWANDHPLIATNCPPKPGRLD